MSPQEQSRSQTPEDEGIGQLIEQAQGYLEKLEITGSMSTSIAVAEEALPAAGEVISTISSVALDL